ncbi:oxidoreductase [Nitrospirillum sp. BR 11163]|uniref:oxidoreductase n=1 Tax=Nitrospirillum sp. BR 11163 TaxID=3104323 RepID=UPI002AFF20B4|nr:oxidoreductase [Nitrospirillum sp. BR 11163]MEA1673251.1 oxidoreductase [Nitrospirillum sp. BR 11163]
MKAKTALVTGASSGIGAATARLLKKEGFTVYAAARRVELMKPLEEEGIRVLPLDITDEASVHACVEAIQAREGRIDIVVNNAGYGSYGAVEEVPLEEARRQFEVNIFGLARLTQLVLPAMRENHFGKIVNVTSIGGKIYSPFGAWYHATKHALEGWSDALRIETAPFGIDVIIVEPGGIRTPWGGIAVDHLRRTSGSSAYAAAVRKVADGMAKLYAGNQLSDPSVVGQTIARAVTAARPRTRYAVGYMARTVLFMRWLLPDRLFDRMIVSMAG